MKKRNLLLILSLISLFLFTSCVKLDETEKAITFNSFVTGIYLIIMGFCCNQILCKAFFDKSNIYNDDEFNPDNVQVCMFMGFVVCALMSDIGVVFGIKLWIGAIGFVIGLIIAVIWCKIALRAFHKKKQEWLDGLDNLNVDAESLAAIYEEDKNPVRMVSKYIGIISALSIILGCYLLYPSLKSLWS